jgi:hypothetical protein
VNKKWERGGKKNGMGRTRKGMWGKGEKYHTCTYCCTSGATSMVIRAGSGCTFVEVSEEEVAEAEEVAEEEETADDEVAEDEVVLEEAVA